jgi:hypothetical protein
LRDNPRRLVSAGPKLFAHGAFHRGMNSTPYRWCSRRIYSAALLGFTPAVLLLAGCGRRPVIVQSPPATVIQAPAPAPAVTITPAPSPQVIVMKEAPPPPRPEPMPPPPSSQYVWIAGYWSVRDGRQEWVSGHWEIPPRTASTWVAPRWERQGDGYIYVPGYWQ